MTAIDTLRKLEVRVATLEKILVREEMALRIASVKLAEKSAVEVFKKIAPSYKNKKTKKGQKYKHANELMAKIEQIHNIFWETKDRDVPWYTAG